MTEQQVATTIADYLKLKRLLYRFDIGADIKLTIGQAVRSKRLQGDNRGYPDLFIAEPKNGYHGLFIELKKDADEVYKKGGGFKKNAHLKRQLEFHESLRAKGYKVVFGLGVKDTIEKIDYYLKGEK